MSKVQSEFMTNAQKKNLAQALYISGSHTRKAIANQVGCTEKTLRNWIDKGNWDEIKEAQTITRSELLRQSYAQLRAINEEIADNHGGIPNKQLSDAKGVIIKEIEILSDAPLHNYIQVGNDFAKYLTKNHPKDVQKSVMLFNEMIEEIAEKEGF